MKIVRKTLLAALALCGLAVWAEEKPATFETAEPLLYADGATKMPTGEWFALVWVKTGETFPGLTWDCQSVDSDKGKFVKLLAQVNASGVCAPVELTDLPETGGALEVIALDTRLPDGTLSAGGSFVSGWAQLMQVGELKSPLWHSVKVSGQGVTFAFDPTANLAAGYAVVSPAEGSWVVYPLPTAYAAPTTPGVVDSRDGFAMLVEPDPLPPDPFTLEVTYKFDAFQGDVKAVVTNITPLVGKDAYGAPNFKDFDKVGEAVTQCVMDGKITEAQANTAADWLADVYPFWDWNCDFEVSFDHPIKARSYLLAGQYDSAVLFGFTNWVCSSHNKDLAAGESLRLLKDNGYKGVYVTYYEICSRVQSFLCGALNLSESNWGTTMTVKLNIYDNTNRCDEKGKGVTVGIYRYKFRGPLNVTFANEDATIAATLPDNISGDAYDVETPLPKPTYTSEAFMFAGWTNAAGEVVASVKPDTYYKAEAPLALFAKWEKVTRVEIVPSSTAVTINVTESWIGDNVDGSKLAGKTEEEKKEIVKEELNKVDDNGLTKWENYVIGIQDASAAIEVETTDPGTETSIPIVSNLEVPAVDSGFKVTYSLDKVESDEKTVVVPGEESVSKDLAIDLEVEKPTGYYKMNVIVTSEEDPTAKVVVTATNTLGVLKVENQDPLTVVTVPWRSIEQEGDITVDQLVKVSTLTGGDLLHVYSNRGTYDNYELVDGEWEPVTSYYIDEYGQVTTEEAPLPEDKTVSRGEGVWLERQDPEKPFYLYGEYDASQATTKIVAPDPATEEERVYNLIGAPSIEATNLNDLKTTDPTKTFSENDTIMVMRGGIPTYYTYKSGKWGYDRVYFVTGPKGRLVAQTERVEDDVTIEAGMGFWYVSGGGEPEIAW